MKRQRLNRGIAPIIILLIVAVLTGGGSAVYLKAKDKPVSLESIKENIFGLQGTSDLESLKIDTEGMDFSLSPLPSIEVPALNLDIPKIETPEVGNVSGKLDITIPSVDKNSINIPMPSVSNITPTISIPSVPTTIPTNIPATIPTNTAPADTNTTGGGSAPSGAPQVDCSMFSSVPSCSYVPAGEAQSACKKCFPNK